MRDRESDSATLYHRRRLQDSARNMSERMLKKKEEKKCLNLAEKYAKKFIANALRKKEKTVKACIGRITDKEKTAISTFHGKLPIKEYRATIHPNSKLVIAEEDKIYEKFITTTADQNLTKKQVEKAYRMQTLSDQKLIKQQRFKEIYSTGPIKPITQVS